MRRVAKVALVAGLAMTHGCGKTEEKKSAAKAADCDTGTASSGSPSASGSTAKKATGLVDEWGLSSGTTSTSGTASEAADSGSPDCTTTSGTGSKTTKPAKATTGTGSTSGGSSAVVTTTVEGPGTGSETVVATDATLGKVEGEATDTGFAGKSTYALLTDTAGAKSLTFLVLHTEAKESQFKKIKDWGKCKACTGKDDTHCKAATGADSLSVTFISSLPGADVKIDKATGFPKGDANEKKDQTDFASGMSISLSTVVQAKTTGKFTFTHRPAKVGDEWAADADFMFDAKKYKAKLSGKVYQNAVGPTPPTCDFTKEYLEPTYE